MYRVVCFHPEKPYCFSFASLSYHVFVLAPLAYISLSTPKCASGYQIIFMVLIRFSEGTRVKFLTKLSFSSMGGWAVAFKVNAAFMQANTRHFVGRKSNAFSRQASLDHTQVETEFMRHRPISKS